MRKFSDVKIKSGIALNPTGGIIRDVRLCSKNANEWALSFLVIYIPSITPANKHQLPLKDSKKCSICNICSSNRHEFGIIPATEQFSSCFLTKGSSKCTVSSFKLFCFVPYFISLRIKLVRTCSYDISNTDSKFNFPVNFKYFATQNILLLRCCHKFTTV